MAKKSKVEYKTDIEKISSFRELFELAAFEAGDKIAYKYKVEDSICEVTYNAFIAKMSHLGAFLSSIGMADKTIACTGNNSFQWIVSFFTVMRSEGVFVPIDKDLPEKDIIHLVNDCEAKAIFCSEKAEQIISDNIDAMPLLKYVICFDRSEDDGMFLSFDRALEKGSHMSACAYLHHPDRVNRLKMIVYTSGTTGASKGVMLSEKNMLSCVYNGLKISTIYDVGLSVLPYHHTYEANMDLVTSFYRHTTLCINENLGAILKNLQIYKPDYIFVVPALVEMLYSRIIKSFKAKGLYDELEKAIDKSRMLLKVGIDIRAEAFQSIHEIFGGNLKKIVSGGAPLRAEIGEFFNDIGIELLNGYGITECSPLVAVNDTEHNDSSTVGFPLPSLKIRIDEPNDENIGEIAVKGESVMLGYYNQPEATAQVLRDGWFSTGDYGYINKIGQLVVSGRKKNIIVLSNGKNIYPEELENYIQGIDYVDEVVVLGGKNEYGEENSLIAEVYLNEVKTSTEVMKSIRAACRHLPIYKQISEVIIRDEEFEKTTTNKIKRDSAEKYIDKQEKKRKKQELKQEKKEAKENK